MDVDEYLPRFPSVVPIRLRLIILSLQHPSIHPSIHSSLSILFYYLQHKPNLNSFIHSFIMLGLSELNGRYHYHHHYHYHCHCHYY